jgi:hypothetical protein
MVGCAREAAIDERAQTAAQLRDQAEWCRLMGSPLYARLLTESAADVEADGPAWRVLEAHAGPGRGAALALRFMAAVHRLVLSGQAPGLAVHYPSMGGRPGAEVWPEFRALLAAQEDALRALAAHPCQTNEVGRCAALMFGFLEAVHQARLPLRLLEVGASAGLNLRWDGFRFGIAGGSVGWGDTQSPVDLTGHWDEPPPHLDGPVHVAERRGCDPHPLDPADEEARLRLRSSVWADQGERFQRLQGALQLAARVPARVEEARLGQWLPARLAETQPGTMAIVYHSVVEEYLPADELAGFHAAMEESGARATPDAPLAWVRLEPFPGERRHELTLQIWPGGPRRRLALCGAHGAGTRRFVS